MSYTEVFGGGSINPSQRTYLSLVTAIDVVLAWPIEQQITGENVAADIMDIDATSPGLNVDFDDARIVSDGYTGLVVNVGAQTVTIRDSAGGTIISLAPGEAWFIYLTDNSTAAGVWRTFQLGATVSVANASALAGAGLKAIATSLNQTIPPTLTAVTPINWVDADRAQFTIWTGGVGVLNLPAAGTVGSDWFSIVRNDGTGDLTVTPPAGTIDDAVNLVMAPGTSCFVVTDGANFYTVGLGQSTAGTFDFVQIDVSGSGDFNLSGVQLNRISYRFIGALTGNRIIRVPNTVQQYWVDNSTTGAFTLSVATAAQVSPVEVLQNNRNIFYCDGTDVIDAETGTLTPPIGIGQGGTGALTAPNALINLGATPEIRLINTLANSGLANGGDLTADRDLALDSDNLVTELVVDTFADTIPYYDDSASAMRKAPFDAFLPAANPSVIKTVATDRTSDIVPTADPVLTLTFPVAGFYIMELELITRDLSGTSNGWRCDFATVGVLTNSYYRWAQSLFSGGGAWPYTVVNPLTTEDILANTSGAGDTRTYIQAKIRCNAAATVTLLWAQEASNVSAVRMDANSVMSARLLAAS